jgi:hypothetical protein
MCEARKKFKLDSTEISLIYSIIVWERVDEVCHLINEKAIPYMRRKSLDTSEALAVYNYINSRFSLSLKPSDCKNRAPANKPYPFRVR